uniref:UDP-glycosyltransferase 87A1-like protein n=1 Tax=Rheum officinale TaxID=137220 RepID=A0A7L9A2T1_RHEOF|nr:UDP-glycosyltransferase 87A1-like protein [Rheum officinale]
MDASKLSTTSCRHVAFIPHPGRGHVNPMLNLCKLIASRRPDLHVSFILTEEWLALLGSQAKPINFATIPNVLPSELVRGSDLLGFLESVQTEMTEPVERLLNQLEPPPDLIIADCFLSWAVELGKRRKIPVASFWPASPSSFTAFYHHQLILSRHFYPLDLSGSSGEERIDFIPGIPSIRLADLPGEFQVNNKRGLNIVTTIVSTASKAQCIIFRTIKELEESALTSLRASISIPLYPVGPAIPNSTNSPNRTPDYIEWLDTQQERSVLYISLGSFLSATSAQVDELAAGLKDSAVPFLWVARSQTDELSPAVVGDKGMVVSWCDQMRVLRHASVGGFLTHCGWNSALETAFAGVAALTFPLGIDQTVNSKVIVEDWGIGWRMKNEFRDLVRRERVSEALKRFMDLESSERMELDSKCAKLNELLQLAVAEDGSTSSLDEFFSDFLPIQDPSGAF